MRQPDIVNMLFGSHLYGLNGPDSDLDYKGVFMPTRREILLGNCPRSIKHSTGDQTSRNGADDIDTEIVSLPRFIEHACNGETFAIDMLHCNKPISTSPIWEELVSKRTMFYSKSLNSYIGYVKKQAAKYGLKGTRLACIRAAMVSLQKLPPDDKISSASIGYNLHLGEYARLVQVAPTATNKTTQLFYEVNGKKYQGTNTVGYVLAQLGKAWDSYGARAKQAETNEGVDWKALSHALRACYQALDIYVKGDFKYPLNETDYLLKVKRGQLDYKTQVGPELERCVEDIQKLCDKSEFPAKTNRNYWDDWLVEVYNKHLFSS